MITKNNQEKIAGQITLNYEFDGHKLPVIEKYTLSLLTEAVVISIYRSDEDTCRCCQHVHFKEISSVIVHILYKFLYSIEDPHQPSQVCHSESYRTQE
jgi:hypothetical protein